MGNLSSFIPPAISSIINVATDFGAVADGVVASDGTVTGTDNTTAFVNAITAAQPFPASSGDYGHWIYVPPGKYVVSDRLDFISGGTYGAAIRFIGEHVDTTEIILKNASAGYTNAGSPKPVFFTASQGVVNSNTAFKNAFYNLTVTIGAGNPGAIAIDLHVSNTGGLKNVHIRSVDPGLLGYSAIAMTRTYPGPGFLENVVVDGFNYALDIGSFQYGMILEHFTIRNQLVAGVRNTHNLVGIRDFISVQTNGIPAILNNSVSAFTTIMEADLSNSGGTSTSALNNVIGGYLRCRNIRSTGYTYKLANKQVGGSTVDYYSATQFSDTDEFTNGIPTALHPGQRFQALHLPATEAPDYYDTNTAEWANVMDYGATHGNSIDQSPYIQAAMNSGKSTIYLPAAPPTQTTENNNFCVKTPITVPPSVKRIIGFMSCVVSSTWPTGSNLLNIADGTTDSLFIENLWFKSSSTSILATVNHSDAVCTTGSNIVTSASANFTSAYVGRALTDGTNDAQSAFPANTLITAVTDTHTVVVSNYSAVTGTRLLRSGGNTSTAFGLGGGHWIEHASRRPLVLNELVLGGANLGISIRSGSGPVYMRCCFASFEMEPGTRVFARGHNMELPPGRRIINNGGDLWMFGLKIEYFGCVVRTLNGGRTEVEAGFMEPTAPDVTREPGFECIDASHSLSYTGFAYQQYHAAFDPQIRETKNSVTYDLTDAQTVKRYNGFSAVVPFHVGRLVN